jgi:hypothetical protein
VSALRPAERDFVLSTKAGWTQCATAPARTRPQLLSRARLRALGGAARIEYEEERAVWHANLGPLRTPQLTAIHADLDDIVAANRQDGDKVKGAAVIDAFPGLGKTTIAQTFAKAVYERHLALYGPRTAAGHERVPVLYTTLTSATSKRSFNAALCRFFNLPGCARGTAEELGHRAADAVSLCEVRLCVVDDVHFLDVTRRDGREVANHFKYLANTFPVTFLYVGVGLARRGLLSEGLGPAEAELAQNARRWTSFDLAPFEVDSAAGRRTWRRLLLAIERDLVLADAFPGMLVDRLSDYLFARSSGHFASLMALVARGCRRAVRTGAEQLTADLLDQVRNDAAAEAARTSLTAALAHRAHPAAPTPSARAARAPR